MTTTNDIKKRKLPLKYILLASVFFLVVTSTFQQILVVTSTFQQVQISKAVQNAKKSINHFEDNSTAAEASLNSYSKHNEEVCTNHTFGQDWDLLCQGGIASQADSRLLAPTTKKPLHVIQIGAHTGFEPNDPLAKGLSSYIHLLTQPDKSRITWTFVEPSPPNYKRLMENINIHQSQLKCQMKAVNAAVISDTTVSTDGLVFHSINETIDPETGIDSKTGKKLPIYITQLSGFSMKPILFNKNAFRSKGLDYKDYVVKTNVTALRFSELMKDIMYGQEEKEENNDETPFLLLIDTEGFDCDILLGIMPDSKYLPQFLVFEHHQCGREKKDSTYEYLQKLGYNVTQTDSQNTVAYRSLKAKAM
mmetsp:Transcript_28040/g.32685  ORF Transcript_28040/g.32685 Transcript_28040/m.32685 type:complete len:363 (-) Transcript_28040:87-1175(-)